MSEKAYIFGAKTAEAAAEKLKEYKTQDGKPLLDADTTGAVQQAMNTAEAAYARLHNKLTGEGFVQELLDDPKKVASEINNGLMSVQTGLKGLAKSTYSAGIKGMTLLSDERDALVAQYGEVEGRFKVIAGERDAKARDLIKYQGEVGAYKGRAESAEAELGVLRGSADELVRQNVTLERTTADLREQLAKTQAAQGKAVGTKVENAVKAFREGRGKAPAAATPMGLDELLA